MLSAIAKTERFGRLPPLQYTSRAKRGGARLVLALNDRF